ncbi:unnamed protein product [Trichogramma brassicae]|uniref:Uncharacterized protein n=1 Tax=Trichogramma brassicae TaxID=86971 RepID=A0A6H5J3U4_9HYME|nr:unnamed protein product [Trichogramma brassicae]
MEEKKGKVFTRYVLHTLSLRLEHWKNARAALHPNDDGDDSPRVPRIHSNTWTASPSPMIDELFDTRGSSAATYLFENVLPEKKSALRRGGYSETTTTTTTTIGKFERGKMSKTICNRNAFSYARRTVTLPSAELCSIVLCTRGRIRRCARQVVETPPSPPRCWIGDADRRLIRCWRSARMQIQKKRRTETIFEESTCCVRIYVRKLQSSASHVATIYCKISSTAQSATAPQQQIHESFNTRRRERCRTVNAWDRQQARAHATSSACVNNRQQESLRQPAQSLREAAAKMLQSRSRAAAATAARGNRVGDAWRVHLRLAASGLNSVFRVLGPESSSSRRRRRNSSSSNGPLSNGSMLRKAGGASIGCSAPAALSLFLAKTLVYAREARATTLCFCATLQHALSAVVKFSRRHVTEARDANYNIINIYSVYNTCHRRRCRQYTIFAFASYTYMASVSLLVVSRTSDELCQLMMMNRGRTAADRESKFTFDDHLAIAVTRVARGIGSSSCGVQGAGRRDSSRAPYVKPLLCDYDLRYHLDRRLDRQPDNRHKFHHC